MGRGVQVLSPSRGLDQVDGGVECVIVSRLLVAAPQLGRPQRFPLRGDRHLPEAEITPALFHMGARES